MGALLATGGVWTHVNGGDLHGMFVPRYEFAARSLAHERRIPLWDPTQFCGLPALALSQGGPLYPPALLLFAVLRPRPALQAFYAFHVFVLAWGMIVWLCRAFGVPRWATAIGAAMAIAGLFRGPLYAAVDHPSFLASLAWVPVMLVCWERAVAGDGSQWLAGLALAVAMQWLAGYPD